MSLRNALKAQICLPQMNPNFPLGDFVDWASHLDIARLHLLHELDELQTQLDLDSDDLRNRGKIGSLQLIQHDYWCFYCAQVRTYYRLLMRYPDERCRSMLPGGAHKGNGPNH